MGFPAIPERLRAFFDQQIPGFWSWWQAAKWYLDKLSGLYDSIDITNPQAGDILVYDATAKKWKNQQP
jgi:hypothetical protein